MGFIDWLKLVFGTEQFNAHIAAMKSINDEYRLKIEEQRAIIMDLEADRGKRLNEDEREVQYEREKEAHMQLIECIKEKRDLQEEIIFLKIDLERLKKNM